MAAWPRRGKWQGSQLALLLAAGLVTAGVRAGEDGVSRIDLATQLDQLTTRVHIVGETTATATLAERIAEYRVPGVSIALLENGEIVQTLAAGLRDPARGLPVNPETLFQAGSISKAVAVVGMLQEVGARDLDLDAPVNTMLERWQVPAHAWQPQAPVTLRLLASHSAGTTVPGFQGYAAGTPVPTLLQVLAGAAPANSAPVEVTQRPGQGYRYSGGGTTIIQLLLEDVTGEPFAALLQRRVLSPAGMSRSSFEQPLSGPHLADAALPYRADGEAVTGGPHTYPEMAAAGLWTTPTDLLRFAAQIQDALRGAQDRILSPRMAAAAVTRQPGGLGLGLFLGPPTGRVTSFSHGGANAGYRAQLHASIEGGNGIAIMTNSDSGRLLIGEIMQAVAPYFGWEGFEPVIRARVTLDAAELERLVGDYRSSWPVASTVQVRRRDDRLLLTVPDFLQEAEFLPADALNFFSLENIGLTFETDASGGISGLVLAGVRAAREEAVGPLTSAAGAAARDSADDARLGAQFRKAFALYCRSGTIEEVGITAGSATLVCDCLYDYARDRTSQSVKQAIVALPSGSTVFDFDLAYANASDMERTVVDSITRRYVQCVDTKGVTENTGVQGRP